MTIIAGSIAYFLSILHSAIMPGCATISIILGYIRSNSALSKLGRTNVSPRPRTRNSSGYISPTIENTEQEDSRYLERIRLEYDRFIEPPIDLRVLILGIESPYYD